MLWGGKLHPLQESVISQSEVLGRRDGLRLGRGRVCTSLTFGRLVQGLLELCAREREKERERVRLFQVSSQMNSLFSSVVTLRRSWAVSLCWNCVRRPRAPAGNSMSVCILQLVRNVSETLF